MTREELVEKYGWPTRLPDDIEGKVIVFGHESHESARAFADSNKKNNGHPTWVERRYEQWVSVVDLRPALAQIEKDFKDGH